MEVHHSVDLNGYAMGICNAVKDPRKFKKFVQANKKELSCWGLLIASVIILYFGVSDGDFSFCYTVSAIVQMFGFFLIAQKAHSSKSVTGLSLNTFICYAVSFFAKLTSLLFFEGYLPADATGEVIYRVSEVLAFVLCLITIYLIAKKFRPTYNEPNDRVKPYWLIIPTFILAFLIHPSFNVHFLGDFPWTFGLYLEAVAMLPQLYMFTKQEEEIEVVTSHFVASQGFSRILALVFWLSCYDELNDEYNIGRTPLFPTKVGYFVLLFQIVQILLFSDFLYEYIKNLRKGLSLSIDRFIV